MNKSKRGKIIILSGPSGVGKGSVNKLLFKDNSLHLNYSISMTTRPKREGEIDGVNYFFVSKDQFKQAIANNELIEYAVFIDNYYGTPKNFVEEKISKGENVILEIEVVGAMKVLKEQNPNDLLSIFLMPPSLTQLKNRLFSRGTETEDIVKMRLEKALLEIPLKYKYQYVIENDTIENAVSKIKDVLQKENITDYDFEKSNYYSLHKIVNEIVEQKYMFFVKNWRFNFDLLNKSQDYSETNHIKQLDDDEFKHEFVNMISLAAYKQTLENGNLDDLLNKDFVDEMIEKLMLNLNFYSI